MFIITATGAFDNPIALTVVALSGTIARFSGLFVQAIISSLVNDIPSPGTSAETRTSPTSRSDAITYPVVVRIKVFGPTDVIRVPPP